MWRSYICDVLNAKFIYGLGDSGPTLCSLRQAYHRSETTRLGISGQATQVGQP